jgi:hypothetical protein
VTDDIDDRAAEDLQRRADDAFNAYQDGDPEEVVKKLEEFANKFAETVEKDEITLAGAGRIDGAFDDFVRAIESDPPVVVDEGGGDEDDEGGPPSHSNSGGNGNGDDD